MNLNKVLLAGNVTRDPELRALPSGSHVCEFGVATNRRIKRNERWEDEAEFHNVVTFGKTAEFVSQYFKKGSAIFVEGRLHTRSWDGEKGKQYRTEIIADQVQFGAPRAAGTGAPSAGQPAQMPSSSPAANGNQSAGAARQEDSIAYPTDDINPDDIPF